LGPVYYDDDRAKESPVSEKDMEKLPERTAIGDKPAVKRKVAVRTVASAVLADAKRLLGRLRRKT
jgi:hypothetical protein